MEAAPRIGNENGFSDGYLSCRVCAWKGEDDGKSIAGVENAAA